jgi:predicted permease
MMMVNQLMPVAEDRLLARGNRSLMLKARLGPGITIEQARAAASTISQRLAADYPDTNKDRAFSMLPTRDVAIHPMVDRVLVPVAFLLLAAVALVLVIACTNLAGFLLARALDRRKEIAVRLALGAKRIQLVRQLVVESLILALLGGAAGVLVAHFTLNLLMRFQPPLPIPLRLDVGLDERVFVFTLVVSVVAGLAFGLVPGLQGTRAQVMPVLRDEAGTTGTRRRRGMRDILVIMQVAVSVLLLIGSGLFVRSLQKAQAVDPGFDTGPAAILWPNFQLSGYDEARGRLILDALVQRLRSSPGVSAVGVADRLPLGAAIMTQDFSLDGAEPPPGQDPFHIDYTHVDAGYFEALRVPLVAGRSFTAADGPNAPRVAIVSEATVRRFWPEGEAVGRLFYLRGQSDALVTVIGVVRDTKVRTLGESARPYVYLSVNQQYLDAVQLVVRGTGSSAQLLANARRTALEVDPQLVLFEAKTMEEHLSLMLYPPRMAALLLSVFGGLALLLSAVGLYGVVSYAVARRTREVGVRMALGATRRDVLSLMLQGGLRLVGAGSVVGLVLGAALTWSIAGFLFGVRATDLVTFVAVPFLLGFVGLLASWVPARRASNVDPLAALRAE